MHKAPAGRGGFVSVPRLHGIPPSCKWLAPTPRRFGVQDAFTLDQHLTDCRLQHDCRREQRGREYSADHAMAPSESSPGPQRAWAWPAQLQPKSRSSFPFEIQRRGGRVASRQPAWPLCPPPTPCASTPSFVSPAFSTRLGTQGLAILWGNFAARAGPNQSAELDNLQAACD
jgi:hypothetical protein